jgi:drug/metabolite transporter (DMT)-like permease
VAAIGEAQHAGAVPDIRSMESGNRGLLCPQDNGCFSLSNVFSLELILVFSGWLLLNISLTYYNKYVLSMTHFHFPFLLTAVNKLVGFIVALVVLHCNSKLPSPAEAFKQHGGRWIVHVQGVSTALNIGLNNWSLMLISLTLNQVIKATQPLPTALLSFIVECKVYSWQLYASMTVLVGGCTLLVLGPSAGQHESIAGLLICIGSVAACASWTVLSAVLMQSGEKPLDAVSLVVVSGPACLITLLIFFLAIDVPRMLSDGLSSSVPPAWLMLLYLGGSAGLGSAYDIVHNQFIKLTSSMNMAVMGNTKLVLLVLLSMFTLEGSPSALRIAGVLIALGGIVWYAVYNVQERQAKEKAAKAAASAAADGVDDEKVDVATEQAEKKPDESTPLKSS